MAYAKPIRPKAGTPWGSILSVLMAVGYGVSPIDLIPDVLPLIGIVDDAIVVPLLLFLAYRQYKSKVAQASRQRKS